MAKTSLDLAYDNHTLDSERQERLLEKVSYDNNSPKDINVLATYLKEIDKCSSLLSAEEELFFAKEMQDALQEKYVLTEKWMTLFAKMTNLCRLVTTL